MSNEEILVISESETDNTASANECQCGDCDCPDGDCCTDY